VPADENIHSRILFTLGRNENWRLILEAVTRTRIFFTKRFYVVSRNPTVPGVPSGAAKRTVRKDVLNIGIDT